MGYAIELLTKEKINIIKDLALVEQDTKTRYAIEKRKDLEPKLADINRVLGECSHEYSGLNIPVVSVSFCEWCGIELKEPYPIQNNTKLCLKCANLSQDAP